MKKSQNKNNHIYVYVLSCIIGVICAFIFSNLTIKQNVFANSRVSTKINEIAHNKKLNNEKLNELLIEGLFYHINKTDIHSMYFDQKQYKAFDQDLNGTLVGIGISTMQSDKGLEVKRVFENTPAQKVGIHEGDLIYGAGNVMFKNIKNKSFVEYVKGEANTYVNLKLQRNNENLNVKVQRKELSIPQVYSKIMNKNLYIKIDSFGESVYSEFASNLKKYSKSDFNDIIIDLRNNGGGDLDEVEKIISLFVKPNKTILLRKKHSEVVEDKSSDVGMFVGDKKVKLLINSSSASASEILTISLKELIGAKVFGEKSYGKGSVQQLVPLTDGSAFKYTIEKWFSPNNVGIDHKGINPDYKIKNDKDFEKLEFTKSFALDKVLKAAMEK